MNYLFRELEQNRNLDYLTGQRHFWPLDEISPRDTEERAETESKENPDQLQLFSTERQNYLFN